MNKNKILIPAVISTILLFLATFNAWPYDYYVILRWVVCTSALYLSYVTYTEYVDEKLWIYILIVTAVLFNPIVPIHLDKATWVAIDVVSAVLLLGPAIAIYNKGSKEENGG